MKKNNGFTLIELLVSISILVLILSIAAVSYVQANRRARDGRRQADLEQVRMALEIYRTDIGSYPVGGYAAMIGDLQAPTVYINTTPADPRDPTRFYTYTVVGTGYRMCAALEGAGVTTPCTAAGSCGTCGSDCDCDYCVCNP